MVDNQLMYLVANRVDQDKRVVTFDEGSNCSEKNGFNCFMETSAKTGQNVKELFSTVAKQLFV